MSNNIKNNNQTQQAIKNKLINLMNVTPKDMCIRTKINNKAFDLAGFFNKEQLDQFLTGQTNHLTLSLDKFQNFLKNELEQTQTPKEFLKTLDDKEIIISKTLREKLLKKFNDVKDLAINTIINKNDSQKRKLDQILKITKSMSENTGVYSLHLATTFIDGITSQYTFINAPLILFPIEINVIKNEYELTLYSKSFTVNEKILNLLKKEYNFDLNITDFVQEVTKTKNLKTLLTKISEIIKSHIQLSEDSETITTFNDKKPFVENSPSNFALSDSYVLGIFEPTGGALKYDLEKLVKDDNLVDPFINNQNISKSKFINDEVNNAPIISINGNLNIYQKYAIRSALAQNTLIYGPPGTGKSEVITNIIANALINRKSTLVVAEKKVALDILIERLADLSNFTLFIGDLKNKADFYNKIVWIANKLDNMYYDQNDVKNTTIESLFSYQHTRQTHDNLKKYFENVQDLIKINDDKNTSFLEYIKWSSEIDYELLNFIKNNNSIGFIKEIMAKHSFIDFVTFKQKIDEYIEFTGSTKLNNVNIYSVLKKQKLALTQLQAEFNTLTFIETFKHQINRLETSLIAFLQQNKLISSKQFINTLKLNPGLLNTQKTKLDILKQYYPHLMSDDYLVYLIKNAKKIHKFVKKYLNTNEDLKEKFLLTFLKDSGFFVLTNSVTEELVYDKNVYFNWFQKFNEIPLNNSDYLINLKNYFDSQVFDQNVVLIYLHNWLKNSYINDLGLKNLTFFNEEEVSNYLPLAKLTNDDFIKIQKLINFEKQIIDNSNSMNIDVQQLINIYLEQTAKNNNMANKLANYYLEELKQSLLNLPELTRKRINEIFAIAKRDNKDNVPIKQLINSYYNELKILFPIWISLPELVSQLLPLQSNIFDYGIFDEASQIFMERAYPIVYRCATNIVAGDDKQLKPTSFFFNRNADNSNYEITDNDQVESLLDRAKVALWPEYHLRNHYRSVHRDLIQFSNDFVYNKNLRFVSKNGAKNQAFEVINTNGFAVEGINEQEAKTVIELLNENMNLYSKIIVVTFGAKQSTYIEQLIQKNSVVYPEIYTKYTNGEILISNLENIQGNEGDLVILSVTYGKDENGKFKGTFGPLLLDGGINRLNVAITRARDKMIVVKSFTTNEMTFNVENPNAVVLREFINYCDNLDIHNKNEQLIKTHDKIHGLIDNDIQKILKEYLVNKPEYNLINNYDIGSTIINFAILNKNTNKTIFALMINRLNNNTTVAGLFEMIDNYIFVKNRGYEPYLLDEHYWLGNPIIAKKKIWNKLKELGI